MAERRRRNGRRWRTAGYYRVSTVGESGFALGEADRVVIRAAHL
jgi:hypothetical protein